MKKYFGELGQILSQICVIYDSNEKTDSVELTKSLNLVFNNFLKIKNFNVQSLFFSRIFKTQCLKSKVVVLTTITKIDLEFCRRLSDKTNFILYTSFLYKQELDLLEEDLNFLSLIVTSDSESFEMLKSLKIGIPIRYTPLALDLQLYSNLNLVHPADNKKLLMSKSCTHVVKGADTQIANSIEIANGVMLIELDQRDSIESFGLQEYCQVVKTSIHEKLDSTEIYNILRGTGELYVCSNLDHLGALSDYALAAGVKFIDLHKSVPKSNERDLYSIDNDYRKVKQQFVKTFFKNLVGKSKNSKQILVEIPNDAGFFAFFNNLVSVKSYWEGLHGYERVIPEWSSASVSKFWSTQKFTSYCYAGIDEGNVFYELFESTEKFDNPESFNSIGKSPDLLFAHSPNFSADPYLTYVWQDQLYRSSGFDQWRLAMNETLGELTPQRYLLDQVDEVFKRVKDEDYVIGVHVRHPSHAKEQPGLQLASVENYLEITKELFAEKSMHNKRVFIFIASDQDVVISKFITEFGDRVLCFIGLNRVSISQSKAFDNLPRRKQIFDGHQIQHIRAADETLWSKRLAEDVIMEAWALSRSQILVHSTSNVATAALYINPQLHSLPIRNGDNLKIARARQSINKVTSII